MKSRAVLARSAWDVGRACVQRMHAVDAPRPSPLRSRLGPERPPCCQSQGLCSLTLLLGTGLQAQDQRCWQFGRAEEKPYRAPLEWKGVCVSVAENGACGIRYQLWFGLFERTPVGGWGPP